MKITIINDDKFVSVDGLGYSNLSFDMPENISAVQWDGSEGEIEYKEVNKHKPANEVITSMEQFNGAYLAWETQHNLTLNPLPLTDEQNKEICKMTAKSLLLSSDWAVLPDVNLANKADFESYRSALRDLVINPVVSPVYPSEPQPVWA